MNGTDAIERVFHEPKRMAILSVLCASRAGFFFTELRDRCGLTNGSDSGLWTKGRTLAQM